MTEKIARPAAGSGASHERATRATHARAQSVGVNSRGLIIVYACMHPDPKNNIFIATAGAGAAPRAVTAPRARGPNLPLLGMTSLSFKHRTPITMRDSNQGKAASTSL